MANIHSIENTIQLAAAALHSGIPPVRIIQTLLSEGYSFQKIEIMMRWAIGFHQAETFDVKELLDEADDIDTDNKDV